jgi:hypothetical protein
MQATKHNEQVCTPIQLKLNTIVDNTTIALKSQLNALFADLLVESEEYNETKSILLTLPIVKKLISATAYVAALNQADADQAPPSSPINISQTCTFNYDSLNHITPPIIDEDDNEDTQEKENTEVKESESEDEDADEEDEESIVESEVQELTETTVSVLPSVIETPSLSNEEAKENICLEIIEPDEQEEDEQAEEDYDEGDEQDIEVEEEDDEVEEEEQEAVEDVVELPKDEPEEEQDEEEVEDEEVEQDEVEEEVEEPKTEEPKTEEPKTEAKEEESEEEEEPSSEEELVTEEETKEESEDEEEESEGEGDEDEDKDEDDGEEVFEIDIFGKTYYTNNATNGDIYSVDENGDPGDEVGKFVNGIATFAKK